MSSVICRAGCPGPRSASDPSLLPSIGLSFLPGYMTLKVSDFSRYVIDTDTWIIFRRFAGWQRLSITPSAPRLRRSNHPRARGRLLSSPVLRILRAVIYVRRGNVMTAPKINYLWPAGRPAHILIKPSLEICLPTVIPGLLRGRVISIQGKRADVVNNPTRRMQIGAVS